MKVKIIGYGYVGKAVHTLFPDAQVHDPMLGYQVDNKTDVTFICVPTPLIKETRRLDCSIVEETIAESEDDLIVIRSTVNPGFTDKMIEKYKKNIVFQPEFLGETVGHPMNDQHSRAWIVLGGSLENRRKLIELYQTVFGADLKIRQVTNYEAEVIKLSANRAAAFKVMQCQELYDACQAAGVDYYTIRDAVYGDDPRFNLWWTFVFPDNRGFNSSKCLVKDVPAFAAWAEEFDYYPKLTNVLAARSNEYAEFGN